MVWGIGLSKRFNRTKTFRHDRLRWHLLLSYLAVMLAILSLSIVAVYNFAAHSLYSQFENRLEILAQAASRSLLEIKAQSLWGQQNGTAAQILRWLVVANLNHP